MSAPISNVRPPPDPLLTALADYALTYSVPSDEALDTARWCLADTLACGVMALAYPACTKLLGPVVPGTTIQHGARVPGTALLGYAASCCSPSAPLSRRATISRSSFDDSDRSTERASTQP